MGKTKESREASQPLKTILAKRIKKFRQKHELSQEAFAALCELHRTYIGSVERGERNVTLSTLETFASVMKISVSDLLTETELDQ